MLRTAVGLATRCLMRSSTQHCATPALLHVKAPAPTRQYSALIRASSFSPNLQLSSPSLLQSKESIVPTQVQQTRTITKHSIQSGKRKSAKPVLKSFYRLNWGIWIRTRVRRAKRVYRKSYRRRLRSQEHVFLNATQSTLLDKMVTSFWKKPKYWVDSPYEPYHTREEFAKTRKKAAPAHPPLPVE